MKQPDISVIVPVYNRLKALKGAVESILAQTLQVSEIIIVDDGSSDETSEGVQEHIVCNSRWRDRVRYIRQANQGQSAANNNGISHARGEWLAFNADDDLWLPQKLEWQFRALEKYEGQCNLCFTDAWFMNNPHMKMTVFQLFGLDYKDNIGRIDNVSTLIKHLGQVWMQTVVAKADVVRQVGGLDSELHYQEDQEFLFRLAMATEFCFVGMPMVLIDRTPKEKRHTGQSARWNREDFRLSMLQMRFEKNLSMSAKLPESTRSLLRKQLSHVHSGWASWYLEKEEYARAAQSATHAIMYDVNVNTVGKWALTKLAPTIARKMDVIRDRKRTQSNFGIGW